MDHMDREIVRELIKALTRRELLSKDACSAALDLVDSMTDFPRLVGYPLPGDKEADQDEHSESSQ